jgi:hypothetical protein
MKKSIIFIAVILAIGAAFYLSGQTDPMPPNSKNGDNAPVSSGGCYIGGCSSQVCSDDPNVITTCEYREEYACYRTAKCERQPDGQCGWTPTPELNMCLQNAQ